MQDFERVQEHYTELDKEVTETRGLLNEKDREICQLELVIFKHIPLYT